MTGEGRRYTPREVRNLTGLSPAQLRYLRVLRFVEPDKTVGKHTRYSEEDLAKMRLSVALMDRADLTLHQAIASVRVMAEVWRGRDSVEIG